MGPKKLDFEPFLTTLKIKNPIFSFFEPKWQLSQLQVMPPSHCECHF